MSLDLGYTASITQNLFERTEDNNTSFSVGSNVRFNSRTSLFIYGSQSRREKPLSSLSSETVDILTVTSNYSAELTYKLKPDLSLTGGVILEANDDEDDSNDYDSTGALFRLHYTF